MLSISLVSSGNVDSATIESHDWDFQRHYMLKNLTNTVAQCLELASIVARDRNHEYLSTEHIFFGLLKVDDSIAQSLLDHFSISIQSVIDETEKIVDPGELPIPAGCELILVPRGKTVFEIADSIRAETQCERINQCHLMFGLLHEPRELLSLPKVSPDRFCDMPTVVTQALKNAGLDLAKARAYVRDHLPPNGIASRG